MLTNDVYKMSLLKRVLLLLLLLLLLIIIIIIIIIIKLLKLTTKNKIKQFNTNNKRSLQLQNLSPCPDGSNEPITGKIFVVNRYAF